tara:strand:- start:12 stop:422 length:411 start_codon:yes stop_codon:yes gene_type:complete
MLSALGKLFKLGFFGLVILAVIVFFTGTEVNFSEELILNKAVESSSEVESTVASKSQLEYDAEVAKRIEKLQNSKSKQDKWWEKTDKYKICYGNVTAAHKANGLHTRDRDKSIEIKKQLCKIAATSTTGEGSFWLK